MDKLQSEDFRRQSKLLFNNNIKHLFSQLLLPQKGSKILILNPGQHGEQAKSYKETGRLVSVVTDDTKPNSFTDYYEKTNKELGYGELPSYGAAIYPDISIFNMREKFHYCLLFPHNTGLNGEDNIITDNLREWKCSRLSNDFTAPEHLINMEQMLNATMDGGYFGAVLPENWATFSNRFLKEWNNNAALVANITLPKNSVSQVTCEGYYDYIAGGSIDNLYGQAGWIDLLCNHSGSGSDLFDESFQQSIRRLDINQSPKKWKLLIWQKPGDKEKYGRKHTLFFCTQRYSTFIASLSSYNSEHIEAVGHAFNKTEWREMSVRNWDNLCLTGGISAYHLDTGYPVAVNPAESIRIITASDSKRPRLKYVDTINEIKSDPKSVHVKLGPPIKVYAYSAPAKAAICNLRNRMGYSFEELNKQRKDSKRPDDKFHQLIRSGSFVDMQVELLRLLSEEGLQPYMLETERLRLKKEKKWLDIQLAPIQRKIKVPTETGGKWATLYVDNSIQSVRPDLFELWMSRAKKMRMHQVRTVDPATGQRSNILFDVQLEDVVTMACKQSVINANVMGLGKTREVLFTALLRCQEKVLLVVPSRLIGVWQEELETTIANYCRRVRKNWMGKPLSADYQVIEWAEDCKPENLRTFNIISYENLSRVPKDALFFQCPTDKCKFIVCSPRMNEIQLCPRCLEKDSKKIRMKKKKTQYKKTTIREVHVKKLNAETNELESVTEEKEILKKAHSKWTFANLLRNRFTMIICDESNYIKNPQTKRATALNNLRARSRISITGTPVKGYPVSICNVLNWTLKRSVFPDYRNNNGGQDGARKFEKRYETLVYREDAPPKRLPKIGQPDLFKDELAPVMLRHLRNEPEIAAELPPKTATIEKIIVPMDPSHRHFYNMWLEKFAEWWRLKKIEEDENDPGLQNDLLVKLGYLINASSIPHFITKRLKSDNKGDAALWAHIIGKYKGPVTAKFAETQKMIQQNIEEFEKTIVFCWRRDNLALGKKWCDKKKIGSLRIDGTVSNKIDPRTNRSKKQDIVNQFRHNDYDVLWAGIQSLKEGFNIPEANNGIFMEYTWEPADVNQALARMLRPQQTREVKGTFLCHEGTVDEYIAALSLLKQRSASEGVDHEDFSDFGTHMIPDFTQYANAIVDGTTKELKTKMWLAVDQLRKDQEEED